MGAEILSQRQVSAKLTALWRAYGKVMRRFAGRCAKGFAFRNTQVTLVGVTQSRQPLDGRRKRIPGYQQDIHVDDGLGGQPGHCCAAHMLDGCRQATERSDDPGPKELKELGPMGVVLYHH